MGNTLLHFDATMGYKNVVKYLIEQRTNVDMENKDGKTPLNLAKYLNMKKIITLLENPNVVLANRLK